MPLAAYVLLRTWSDPDGFRPGLVVEGVPGVSRTDMILELDLNEAVEYVRMLNTRNGVTPEVLRRILESNAREFLPDAVVL